MDKTECKGDIEKITSVSKEEIYKEILDYFNGDEMVAKVFQKKYSYNGLETPRDVYMREAKQFAQIEKKYKKNLTRETCEKLSEYGKKRHIPNDSLINIDWETYIFRLFYNQEILSGGSVTASLGSGELSSISNCTVVESPLDSLIGLNRTAMEIQLLAKRRAGVGTDLSTIRPKGSFVNNQSKISAGVTLWMEKYSNAIKEVAQNNRRGAGLITLDCHHPDILDFIRAKEDLTKVTGANISVKWTEDFFQALEADEDWVTTFPIIPPKEFDKKSELINKLEYNTFKNIDGIDFVKYKAKELWETFIRLAWTNGEPGAVYWDNIQNYNPANVYEYLKALSLNPCGEVSLAPNDSCRLIHKNLTKCVKKPYTENSEIDENELYVLAYENVCMGDDIVDMEIDAIDRILNSIDPVFMSVCEGKFYDLKEDIKQYKLFCIEEDKEINEEFILWLKFRDKGLKGRRCGCGFVGFGELFAMLNKPYGDVETIQNIMKIIFKAELDAEIDLAIIRGPFPLWEREKEFFYLRGKSFESTEGYNILHGNNEWYEFLFKEFPEEAERMITYGRRNSSWSSIAPTGCVVGDTIINMSNGDIPIKELFEINGVDLNKLKGIYDIWIPMQYDFFVKDIFGKEQKVIKLYWNGESKTKKIRLANDNIECTPNHKFLKKINNDIAEWIMASELKPGDKILKKI